MKPKYTTGRKGAFEDQSFWRTTPSGYWAELVRFGDYTGLSPPLLMCECNPGLLSVGEPIQGVCF